MAVQHTDVDFSKSTGAYPMEKEPKPLFVDADIDYSKSTGAYPMFDDRNATERAVEHYTAEVDAQFITPGPSSSGQEDLVKVQRKDLGLSSDPSGEKDAGYEARPSSVSLPGADGVDREAKVVEAPQGSDVKGRRRATGK